MPRIPGLPGNPVGELLKRVDRTLESVEPVLGRVDATLGDVDGTLTSVSGTLAESTAVLQQVRDLLVELEAELALLREVPAMKIKLDEIHAAVSALRP